MALNYTKCNFSIVRLENTKMKFRNKIVFLLIALISLSLFGCAKQPGGTGESAMPGDSEQSETTPETTDGELSVQTGVRSSADIDLSELVVYERFDQTPVLCDAALDALAKRFEGYESVRVTGILFETRVENHQVVPDYYSCDVIADGEKYTMDITFDEKISIYPYEYGEIVAENTEGLLPVMSGQEIEGNISGKYKMIGFPVELTVGGHKWTVEENGETRCDGSVVVNGYSRIYNLYLTDVDRDGTEDIILIIRVSEEMESRFLFAVVDGKEGRMLNGIIAVWVLSERVRDSFGLLKGNKMMLALSAESELLLLDEPKAGADSKTRIYKVCYDPLADDIRFVYVEEHDGWLFPSDLVVTG